MAVFVGYMMTYTWQQFSSANLPLPPSFDYYFVRETAFIHNFAVEEVSGACHERAVPHGAYVVRRDCCVTLLPASHSETQVCTCTS
jgi:hypothetical protein